MSMSIHTFSDAELCAFLDGEVTADRHAEISAALRAQPMMQAKLKIWRDQQNWLRAHFAPLAQEPVPDILLQALPKDRAPPFPHEVVPLAMDEKSAPMIMPRMDRVVTWKIISMTLGVLLFATSLFAAGLVTNATSCAPVLIQKWIDQPKSLRGS